MAFKYVDQLGVSPYVANDTTRSWIEAIGRKQGIIKPNVILRMATDTNHLQNDIRTLYDDQTPGLYSKSVMNNGLPGQRIPHLLNFQVNESLDQVTQTASFECLNCLLLSGTTTVITDVNAGPGPDDGIDNTLPYANTIAGTWAQDSFFAIEQATGFGGRNSNGNKDVGLVTDRFGVGFREANVTYRTFVAQQFRVSTLTGFPDPAIPLGDDDDVVYDLTQAQSATGSGAYFILVGNEVMRITSIDHATNTLHVPPGGRAINGVLEAHAEGDTVTLLAHGEPTGDACAAGYLNVDDFHSERAVLRPGTCLASYEGYGDFAEPLYHDFNLLRNYTFTGYWFVDSVEPALGDDGVPRATVNLRGVGAMFEDQKINLDVVQRMKNQFGQWTINGETLFQAAGATRSIPGDWVDYNAWDPTDQYSYPLQIMTEYAQNYAFFQHMQDTQNGLTCIQCHAELAAYLKTHKRETARDRPVGRHIYKESVRVLREDAGPIKTYIRLMATMAAAAWDHPAYGSTLSQKFSKVPNQLFDNIRNIFTGLCFNGQLDFKLKSSDPTFDFTTPQYDDQLIISRRKDLTCPFQSSYDNVPFSQPMLDLADINGATFWITREGYPCFKPYGWHMRPETGGYRHLTSSSRPDKNGPTFIQDPHHIPGYNGEWYLTYGASISSYDSNVSKDQITTQMWVTATTAFDIDNSGNGFTITAAGSGFNDKGEMVWYSPLGGHKQGLALTAGVQQVDTLSLDNQYLGLDWNTNPAGWGLVENLNGTDVETDAKPALYHGDPTVHTHTNGHTNSIKRVQQSINFFLVRGYIDPVVLSGTTYFTVNIDGKFSKVDGAAMQQIHSVLAGSTGVSGASYDGTSFTYKGASNAGDGYGRASYKALREYFTANAYFIKTDIWWYVRNGKTWDEYVAAITGLAVPFTKGHSPKPRQTSTAYDTPLYVIDDKGLQKEVAKWYKNFAQSVINAGNRKVNQTVDQSVSRSIGTNLADPRIQPGDTIFCEIPGHLTAADVTGKTRGPFDNGIYVTQIQRQVDLEQGSYTATYTGTRQQGVFGQGVTKVINPGYDFITE